MSIFDFVKSGVLWGGFWTCLYVLVDFYKEGKKD